ncbi:DUF4240 domain-containing protein [Caulobacter sp. 17J80-11]|nr:DUF4240 domain-containing protein [Caulobacter sp. 17J80-11]
MDALPEARFWALIEAAAEARAGGSEAQAEALRAALQALTPEELVAFEAALAVQMARANRWELWGAATVALGGAPDDGFAYARLWLIGQGREVFERVLADPDALADVLPEDVEAALEFEGLMYVAGDVWCEKTGREAEEWPGAGVDGVDEPAGEPIEEDEDLLAKRYPKLWKRFAEAALG